MSLRTYGYRDEMKKEDVTRCIAKVWSGTSNIEKSVLGPQQCTRKKGFGPDKIYCKQHAKQYARNYQ